ncbi:cytochrome P450 [Mycena albidolilacea]|uniref:Cytochrome P450 n=1 Tax=Mycena albidolilacea TaxID=1033008 RepID=A0AAD7A1F2_9AGAR|nr:cytochrome P450 [Mycena albidolilacea]
MLSRLLASITGTLIAYSLFKILKLWYQELNSPLRHLPGPRSSSFIYGNGKELVRDNGPAVQEKWVQTYGRTLKYPFFFGLSRLYTTDTKALNHFLTNHDIYQRPSPSRYLLSLIVGPGVLVTEGEVHRRQRKIMNPAFGPPQIRELTSIFLEKSEELRNIWASQAASSAVRLDVLPWLNKTTLDIIGLAGFDYPFNSLGAERPTELAIAFAATVQASASLSALDMVLAFVPALRAMPTKFAAVCRTSQDTMNRIGRQILRSSKDEMAESGTFETGRGRDLLSLLVRANTAKDISESQRLSEEEVLAQVPTFLVAGHETNSTGTTWALFALTQNIPAQSRLRAELLSVQTDLPTMDELDTLPYLDCVVREALRVHPPVVSTGRVATQDDVVPLETPWTDKYGNMHETLRVTKGQHVMIPIMMMNRDKGIWGPDAAEFIPERWESEPPISNTLPGVWGQVLTFLGGPRACIGYRFSVIEMKALLFTLVRAFEFELAVPAADIGRKISIVQRPMVRSEPGAGAQMPLLVKPYVRPT